MYTLFTLKVIENLDTYEMEPDTRHPDGGIDVRQQEAFRHICPNGCPWALRDMLISLAHMHGWGVEITVVETKK